MTSSFRTIATFVIVGLQTIFHKQQSTGIRVTYLGNKFRIPSQNDPLIVTIKAKNREHFVHSRHFYFILKEYLNRCSYFFLKFTDGHYFETLIKDT
jgi:hypothetical protein